MPIIKNQNFIRVTFNTNPDIINTNVCPANILAANLIAKLNILIKYENISIGTNIGNNTKGHSGIKICKNRKLYLNNPKIKIEMQIVIDKYITMIIWLVMAMPNGIKLNKLHNNIKINIVKINGKKTKPLLPICCLIIFNIKT
jgi:hypothetical protein